MPASAAQQRPRVHILTGTVCNNNCIFCMEEDRDGRKVTNAATTDDSVRWILGRHSDYEEVCFTSGEPTTRNDLPDFVGWAKGLGYRRISVMTNGRRVGHLPYAAALAKAGIGLEFMDTPAAAQTYNLLTSEGRRLACGLIAI